MAVWCSGSTSLTDEARHLLSEECRSDALWVSLRATPEQSFVDPRAYNLEKPLVRFQAQPVVPLLFAIECCDSGLLCDHAAFVHVAMMER